VGANVTGNKTVRSLRRDTVTDPFLTERPRRDVSVDLARGTKLDRFCIRKKLGQGSLGKVYQAHDAVNERDVAIKVVTVASPECIALASLLKREKAMYDRVRNNEHVLKVNDVFPVQHNGMEWLVLSMELADGGTLRDWLKEYRRDCSTRRKLGRPYIRQMCLAVAALHEAGIGHVDVKPSNFLFANGVLKIADLGASVLLGTDGSSLSSKWKATDPDVKAGTPCYRSPEHNTARAEDLDERSDIYSLGIVIYEILSVKGRPPFEGDEDLLCKLHASVPAPALEGGSEAEARIVQRCLEKDPAKRYQTVRELLADLEGRPDTHDDRDSEAKIEALWADACASLEQGQLHRVRVLCRHLLSLDPDHPDAGEMVQQLDERFEQAGQIYATMGSQMESSGLAELIQLGDTAAQLYPQHPAAVTALIQLAARSERYRMAMEEGLRALARSDWQVARDWFERARSCDPGSLAAVRAVRFVTGILEQIQESRGLMDVAVENENLAEARRLADGLDQYLLERREEAVSFLADYENGRSSNPSRGNDTDDVSPTVSQTSGVSIGKRVWEFVQGLLEDTND